MTDGVVIRLHEDASSQAACRRGVGAAAAPGGSLGTAEPTQIGAVCRLDPHNQGVLPHINDEHPVWRRRGSRF